MGFQGSAGGSPGFAGAGRTAFSTLSVLMLVVVSVGRIFCSLRGSIVLASPRLPSTLWAIDKAQAAVARRIFRIMSTAVSGR
jgi:hypothetical protein